LGFNYVRCVRDVSAGSSGTSSIENAPQGFHVGEPYPNPFNPATTIRYNVTIESPVRLVIYDILGREVRELEKGTVSPGIHEAIWNGENSNGILTGSGVYFYRFSAGEFKQTGKFMLLR